MDRVGSTGAGVTRLALVLAIALALTGCATQTEAAPSESSEGAPPTVQGSAMPPAAATGLPEVVARLTPSVVTVRTGQGIGSGVVYRPDVILTNQHVVGSARDVIINFADGTESPGAVLATDATTDLAVIRTQRSNLPVPVYRTDLPRPGETVLAMGSPLGFENTVTAGIVSGLHRQIPGSAAEGRALVDLIQVDAPISPGNSGGALLDSGGRVIGINIAYIPPSAGAVSLGFAIPAATAVDIANQLLANGSATHPYLGVTLGTVTPQLRQSLGVGVASGALVLGVDPRGPAGSAGVQPGDVIVRFNDRQISSTEDLLGALREAEPDQRVRVELVRQGQPVEVTVTVGRRS